VEQRRIDEASAARPVALAQRREYADHGIDAGEYVRYGHTGALRLPVGRAGEIHDAAHALGHQIVAGARSVRAVLSESRHRAINQPRIFLAELRVVEAKLGQSADLEVLDQHIRACSQLAHNAPAVLAFE